MALPRLHVTGATASRRPSPNQVRFTGTFATGNPSNTLGARSMDDWDPR